MNYGGHGQRYALIKKRLIKKFGGSSTLWPVLRLQVSLFEEPSSPRSSSNILNTLTLLLSSSSLFDINHSSRFTIRSTYYTMKISSALVCASVLPIVGCAAHNVSYKMIWSPLFVSHSHFAFSLYLTYLLIYLLVYSQPPRR